MNCRVAECRGLTGQSGGGTHGHRDRRGLALERIWKESVEGSWDETHKTLSVQRMGKHLGFCRGDFEEEGAAESGTESWQSTDQTRKGKWAMAGMSQGLRAGELTCRWKCPSGCWDGSRVTYYFGYE